MFIKLTATSTTSKDGDVYISIGDIQAIAPDMDSKEPRTMVYTGRGNIVVKESVMAILKAISEPVKSGTLYITPKSTE